jgi:hypothetical protein
MVGWDDDAFHSQVIRPIEENESNICSDIPGGICK